MDWPDKATKISDAKRYWWKRGNVTYPLDWCYIHDGEYLPGDLCDTCIRLNLCDSVDFDAKSGGDTKRRGKVQSGWPLYKILHCVELTSSVTGFDFPTWESYYHRRDTDPVHAAKPDALDFLTGQKVDVENEDPRDWSDLDIDKLSVTAVPNHKWFY